jgi:hypothetical protein
MILIKKHMKAYNDGLENIIESTNTLTVDGVIKIKQSGPIANTDLLRALNIEHETEFTLEND